MVLELVQLIQGIGYLGVTAIIFAESGLLIGFFLPGDSLLFTAGLLAGANTLGVRVFEIEFLIPLLIAAAIFGDNIGYWTGKRFGRKLFERQNSRFFKKDHLEKAEAFYEKHGGKTIVLARFMPFIRTFAPIAAGIADMHYRTFVLYNVIGGIFWVTSITLLGYLFGGFVTDIESVIIPVAGIIVVISFLPAILHALMDKETRTHVTRRLRR